MTSNFKLLYPDIPFNAASITSNLSTDSAYKRIIGGNRCDFHAASARSLQDLWLNFDLGSGISQAASHLAIADADKLAGDTVDRISLRGATVSAFLPLSLSGLTAWFDASRGVTADSTGLVSSWHDVSGNSRHVNQSTAANKPVLSRGDNQENLFSYSEDFTNAVWDKGSYGLVTITANSTTAPDGESTADTMTAGAGTQRWGVIRNNSAAASVFCTALTTYRFSVYVKRTNHDHIWVGDAGDAVWRGAAFNINTGALVGSTNLASTPTITSIGDGWYRVSMTMTATNAHRSQFGVWFNNGNISAPGSFLMAGTETVYIWGAQAQATDRDTDYLATSSVRKPGGVNGLRAIHFNGETDVLQGAAISNFLSDTTKSIFIVFRIQSGGDATRELISSDDGLYQLYTNGSSPPNAAVRNNDGSPDTSQTVDSAAAAATKYLTVRQASGTQYIKLNGGTEDSDATGATSAMTGLFTVGDYSTTASFCGYICEIITSNAAVTAQEIADIEAYLIAKWQTTPTHQNVALDSTDLVGTVDQDYAELFTASSAYRHWWLQLGNSNSLGSEYRFSKAHFGTAFDFGRDPVWGRTWYSEVLSNGVRRLAWNLSFTFEGISDTKVTEFITKIGKYKDIFPVWLSTSSYHDVLGEAEAVYCSVVDYTITPESVNNNEVEIEFQEMV